MSEQQEVLFYNWAPVSDTVYSYGRYLPPTPGFNAIGTAGASTTVTGVSSFRGVGAPFAGFTAGTLLFKRTSSTAADINVVASVTSDNVVVLTAAKTYTGGVGGWWHQIFKVGTTSSDGWILVQNTRAKAVKIVINNLANATGITYSIEGKGWNLDTEPVQLTTGSLLSETFPANGIEIPILETVAALRVGLISGAAPNAADAVSVYLIEQVGSGFTGEN